MRYIFIEDEAGQSVYDIETTTWYAISMSSKYMPKITIECVSTARIDTIGFTYSYVVSFWDQLAAQVDQRCTVKDAKERMEAFVKSAEANND